MREFQIIQFINNNIVAITMPHNSFLLPCTHIIYIKKTAP